MNYSSGNAFALARYNANGTLDSTFGTNGTVRNMISGSDGFNDAAYSVAIQPDGKIVAAGTSRDAYRDSTFALARYNTDGTLDGTFGTNGTVRNAIGGGTGTSDNAASLSIQSDGKIVAAGYSYNDAAGRAFALSRYNINGALDSTFGTNGSVRNTISGGSGVNDEACAVAIQSDGKIVAAGYSTGSAGPAFAVSRYLSSIPLAIPGLPTYITETSVTLNGCVYAADISTTVEFEYGTTPGLYPYQVSASPSTVSGNSLTYVSAALSGLSPGTTYYYRVSCTSTSPANTFESEEWSFATVRAGNVLKFNGDNDCVDFPYTPGLNLGEISPLNSGFASMETMGNGVHPSTPKPGTISTRMPMTDGNFSLGVLMAVGIQVM